MEDIAETSVVRPTVVPLKEVSSKKAKQVAGKSLHARSVTATSSTEKM